MMNKMCGDREEREVSFDGIWDEQLLEWKFAIFIYNSTQNYK